MWVLIKAGDGVLKTLGAPILQTFLGSLCPALLWDKCGWVGKCCEVLAVLWEWRAPGPRGARWDSAPHQFRLHGRCRSCWLSSKTQSSKAMEGPGKFPYTVTSVTSCRGHRVSAGCYPFQPILWWINQASSTAILQRGDHKQFSKNSADITRNFI